MRQTRLLLPAIAVAVITAAFQLSARQSGTTQATTTKTGTTAAQAAPTEPARAITAPKTPLPEEAGSAGVTKFSFIAYGDTRGRHDGEQLGAEHTLVVDSMLATIKRLSTTTFPVKFVIQSGDAVVNGRDGKQLNVSYIPIIERLTKGADVPYFFTAGNHDVTSATDLKDAERAKGLKNLLDANKNLMPAEGSPRRLAGYPTYAFGYGNTFMIAFDSQVAPDETQFNWVKGQLEGLDRKRYVHVIAFMHHPPFSSGPHGNASVALEAATQAVRDRYEPLFREHHVRMTIAGHEHLFEHWVERYEDASGKHRMDHIVSGGGGAPLYTYQGEPNTREFIADKTRKEQKVALEHLVKPGINAGDNPYHYLVVQIDGDNVSVDVVGVDWGVNFKPYKSANVALKDGGK